MNGSEAEIGMEMRTRALDMAIRHRDLESTEEIVKRAAAFAAFLLAKVPPE